MSFTARKLMSASGGAGEGLNVEDVFSTYLYTGTRSTLPISNGIDLAGEGGLVWVKCRNVAFDNSLADTSRGVNKILISNSTSAEATVANSVTAFNSDGFTLGSAAATNDNPQSYASWTFRKAPKFFDVVTYTGDGNDGRTVSHNLGVAPGVIIVKKLDSAELWPVYHRSLTATHFIRLNGTNAAQQSLGYLWGDGTDAGATEPTSTEFTIANQGYVNDANDPYVAYLFAHNDGDGEFGPNADQDIIKCGSYTGNNSTNGPEIDLGFEPQWLMIKNITATSGWWMWDTMRGIVTSTNDVDDAGLRANTTTAEALANRLHVTSTGFKLTSSASPVNDNNTFIYMAIRRGTKVPESGTEVFAVDQWASGSPSFDSSFPVDFGVVKATVSSAWSSGSRLLGTKLLNTNSTAAESTNSDLKWDHMDGFWELGADSTYYGWMWKRAPSFFDVVAYTGNGTAGRTVSHNLGVAPEMMWVKQRNAAATWTVYHSGIGETKHVYLNDTSSAVTQTNVWNDTAPTDTAFTTGTYFAVNDNNDTYIAYLFASLAGISKVGSYTGNGTSTGDSQNIDCGFTNGARFILVKRATGTGMWAVYDTTRGIAAGNDAQLQLNSSAAQYTGADYVDPYSAGFAVSWMWSDSDSANLNANGSTYIFYAIA
jgi:hypothetical protein